MFVSLQPHTTIKRERTHDMKRQHAILTLIVAAMAVLTAGCQKEKESGTVTLTAEIQETLSGNGKVFIDGDTPCRHNADEVFINVGDGDTVSMAEAMKGCGLQVVQEETFYVEAKGEINN